MLAVKYHVRSETGNVRKNNEDAWAADKHSGIFLVADGIGGESGGEIASKIVADTIPKTINSALGSHFIDLNNHFVHELIKVSFSELSRIMRAETQELPGLADMGSTVVMALIRERAALIAHMGDSRAYIYRSSSLDRLTKDHSLIQMLIDTGVIKPEDASKHPAKSQITRCIGMPDAGYPECTVMNLEPGDRLILCSDGLTDMLSDAKIAVIMAESESPEVNCNTLCDAALAAGGKDNVTVMVLRLESMIFVR